MRKEDYIGKKIIGFKFKHDQCSFNSDMNQFVGVEGTIIDIDEYFKCFRVNFNDSQSSDWRSIWSYPIEFCLDRIIDEIPELKIGVLMEVSSYDDFNPSHKRFVMGKSGNKYFAWNNAEKENDVIFDNVTSWDYARPIQEKVLKLTMKQIAEEFGVDKIEII